MAAKGNRLSKKDDATTNLTLAAITQLLEGHHKTLATEFKTSFSQLDSKLDQTQLAMEDHGQCVSSLELTTEDLSQRDSDLKGSLVTLRDNNA